MNNVEQRIPNIKFYLFALILSTIIYIIQAGAFNSILLVGYIFFSFVVACIVFQNFSIQKIASYLWIASTFLVFPLYVVLWNVYHIILMNKSWSKDPDKFVIVLIYSIPLLFGIVSIVLISKYLKVKPLDSVSRLNPNIKSSPDDRIRNRVGRR